jgi:hypothetical protein
MIGLFQRVSYETKAGSRCETKQGYSRNAGTFGPPRQPKRLPPHLRQEGEWFIDPRKRRDSGFANGTDNIAVACTKDKIWPVYADLYLFSLAGLSGVGGDITDVVLAAKFFRDAFKGGR